MFKHYFKTAFRNFKKNKITTFINVLGLSIGVSAALIIFMMTHYDYNFDKYESGANKIYRVVTEGDGWKNRGVPVPLHQAIEQNAHGVQTSALILLYNDNNVKVSISQGNNTEPQIFKSQRNIVFTDKGYFNIFPQQWVYGNAKSSLQNPYQLVLTESRVKQYFPNIPQSQIIGKAIVFSDTIRTTITGIIKDLKPNSDFKYDAFISLSTIPVSNLKSAYGWDGISSNTQSFVKLLPNTRAADVNRQLTAISKEHTAPGDIKITRRLQPLSDIHTNVDFDGKVNEAALRNLVWLAIFLLLLGAINFINLSTAQATERAKEIGIRKTLGSKKGQLIFQFLSETFLLTLFTAIISLAITPLLLQAFSGFIPDGLTFTYFFTEPVVWIFLLLLIIVVSIAAGLYPAFILTKFKPAFVLKKGIVTNSGVTRAAWLRKILVVFQFVIAQVFVIGVFVVDKQIYFELEKNMGFRTEAIINFYVPFDFQSPNNKKHVLKEELQKIPEIQNVSLGSQSPAFNGRMGTRIEFSEKGKVVKLDVDLRNGDTSFLSVYNLKLVAGRNISYSDTAKEFLINETLANQLGFTDPADAINHSISTGGPPLPVVGVMQDFHLASLRIGINPTLYFADMKHGYEMHVALQKNPATWQTAIKKMQDAWKRIYPNADFNYTFLDKTISDFYEEDIQLSTLLTWSAAIAIMISCLGLLGLVIFMTNNRVKEIGIRKVLGANVRQIITLLSMDFIKLLMIAFVIAIPIAWWQTHNWLQNFAYHTTLSWWIFLLSGLVMIAMALMILCIRAGKAAIANPVKSLRTE